MPGVSSHFDHTLGRSVMGQQVLTLGYSCEQGFVPLDSEIFISKVKAQELYEDFKDARSIVGKRYFQAQQLTKPQMAKSMMARAIRSIAFVPNQASASKNSAFTPPRMALAIILLAMCGLVSCCA